MVFACRYGKQQLSEVEGWSLSTLRWFVRTLGEMLEAESDDSGGENDAFNADE